MDVVIKQTDEIARQAWKDGMGDALAAVKLLRERSGLNLVEAAKLIEKTAAQVGADVKLNIIRVPLSAAEFLPPKKAKRRTTASRE
jgi:hypothetical protein